MALFGIITDVLIVIASVAFSEGSRLCDNSIAFQKIADLLAKSNG